MYYEIRTKKKQNWEESVTVCVFWTFASEILKSVKMCVKKCVLKFVR